MGVNFKYILFSEIEVDQRLYIRKVYIKLNGLYPLECTPLRWKLSKLLDQSETKS